VDVGEAGEGAVGGWRAALVGGCGGGEMGERVGRGGRTKVVCGDYDAVFELEADD